MPLNLERTRRLLRGFDFKTLFIEELGWDHYTSILDIPVDGQNFALGAIAEKRGVVVFVCGPASNGSIPDYSIRRKIERQVTKSHHEHLIVYLNADKTRQVWQWVKRQSGKPAQCREHTYYANQSGDLLIQKIDNLAFGLEEEEQLTIIEVGRRARKAFDVEKVTKKFYDRFKTEHEKFLKFLKGIPEDKFQAWYISVMLNRLMFIYFIQKKGFLDNNNDYLSSGLRKSKERSKNGYYKDFLCPLFFEGFAKKEEDRKPETNRLLGKVPYLDGGLFQRHQIEKLHDKEIQIEDAAFENLFAFFEQYNWHLDERPLMADNEINPDVLGYIFEKYINQKQMGAYYTKEDITGYISKNTIIPFLFDQSQKKCKIAFEGEQSVWRLLKEDPDRYIYDAVKKGVELDLPEEIAVGIKNVSKRTQWNKPALLEYALPTEIWREVVARRQHYEEVSNKMSKGEISSINDLVTYNLDIRQFAQDVIENCEGPELLRAIYYTIAGRIPDKSNQQFQPGMSVLDPTCGSGAFLFAALNILEPLYEACLDRMQVFLEELESSGQKHRSDKFGDFREILQRIEKHPNRRYFILKSIILSNLYGVDIMEEATEICKLRLFLKLVAQVDGVDKIEPLPDIDFNIRAGNTLVGFTTYDEVKKAVEGEEQRKFDFYDAMVRIEEKAQDVDQLFDLFRKMQTEYEMDAKDFSDAKDELSNRLKFLSEELDRYLASEYGIDRNNIPSEKKYNKGFAQWRESHQPFHWFIEFYGIIKKGGFDVIIGNPPYVEYSKVRREYRISGFTTKKCGNLYAHVMERCYSLAANSAYEGFIIPTSSISTERMRPLQNILLKTQFLHSTFGFRPSKLFEGANISNMHLSIVLIDHSLKREIKALHHIKWNSEFRPFLFNYLQSYTSTSKLIIERFNRIPRLSNNLHLSVIKKLCQKSSAKNNFSISNYKVYYRTTGGLHYRVFTLFPTQSRKESFIALDSPAHRNIIFCTFSSNLWNMFYYTFSNCLDVARFEIEYFPIGLDEMDDFLLKELNLLAMELDKDIRVHANIRIRHYQREGDIKCYTIELRKSKPIIDKIDRVLAKHYGFTEEELDFIINYDIKYRMGLS